MRSQAVVFLLTGALLVSLWSGCKENPEASAYNPNHPFGAQPQVTAVAPAGGGLAGVTVVTLTGTNFGTTPDQNLVFFDKAQGTVLSASPTQLQVKAPNVVSDTVKILVSAVGADKYSDPVVYKLVAPLDAKFGALSKAEAPVALECDNAGNLYESLVTATGGVGVVRIAPDGTRTLFSPIFSSGVDRWRGMKIGWGGAFYCVAARAIIFQITAAGGNSKIWLSAHGLGNLNDLDFDANGNLWASGPNGNVYRVRKDSTVKSFPFRGDIKAVRVFQNALYLAGKRDSLNMVWRLPIDGNDSLGTEEVMVDFSNLYGANSYGPTSLAFASDGSMFVGTDAPAAIILVHPDKTNEPFYPGLLTPPTVSLTWGQGAFLFQGQGSAAGSVAKINTQMTSAPYYGRQLP